MITIIIFIGKVQGVGFRAATKHIAMHMNFIGCVRNLKEKDQVEMILNSVDKETLDLFIGQIKSLFSIDYVNINEIKSFEII